MDLLKKFKRMFRPINHNSVGGFTLIELVIAIGIFAVLSVIVSISLRGVIDAKASQDERAAQYSALQLTYALLSRDFAQAIDRGNTNATGGGSFIGERDARTNSLLVAFTRAGVINPQLIEPRSTLARVSYQLTGNNFVRLHWPTLDNNNTPIQQVLLTDVVNVSMRYFDSRGETFDNWAMSSEQDLEMVLNAVGEGLQIVLPAAVEVQIQLLGGEQYTWIFALPGIRNRYDI